MEERKLHIGKLQVVLRPSPALLKIVVIVLIVFSMAALGALRYVRNSIRSQTDTMRAEAAAVEHENEELNQRIQEPDGIQSVQDIAQEELDMVLPDTVLIQPQ